MDEVLKFLGLLYRGNELVIGLELENAIKKGKVRAIAFASDISINSENSILSLISEKPMPVTKFSSKESLGQALGKTLITMVGFKSTKAYYSFITKLKGVN